MSSSTGISWWRRRKERASLGPGAVVGRCALLSGDGMRSARVRALTAGVVVAVERAEIERLCAEDPAFAERLAAVS